MKGWFMGYLFGKDTAGRIAARMLQDDFDDDAPEELFPVSIRIPETMRAMLDAMAQQAGCSRNSMAIDLLRAGIQDVLSRLPEDAANDLISEAGGTI